MSGENTPKCASCPVSPAKRVCRQVEGKAPENCPTMSHEELKQRALQALKSPQVFEFARQASLQEAAGYADRDKGYAGLHPAKPRIQETVEFAGRMGYRRLGLVFCAGLVKEAGVVQEILELNGFEVVSAVCKVGRVPKSELGLEQSEHIDVFAREEAMCNPILQAFLLNHYQTELNILMGLCVGHDSLFLHHSQALCTVLAVKDRLLGHAPLAAVYTYDSYYRYFKQPLD